MLEYKTVLPKSIKIKEVNFLNIYWSFIQRTLERFYLFHIFLSILYTSLRCSHYIKFHFRMFKMLFPRIHLWLPWWLGGKESTCQYRRQGFSLWSGKIPHALEQISPCATTIEPVFYGLEAELLSTCSATTEPMLPRASAPQEKLPKWEATHLSEEELLFAAIRESLHSKEDPAQAKNCKN